MASALRGGRFHHAPQPVGQELAEGAAETALLTDEQVMLDDGGLSKASGGDQTK